MVADARCVPSVKCDSEGKSKLLSALFKWWLSKYKSLQMNMSQCHSEIHQSKHYVLLLKHVHATIQQEKSDGFCCKYVSNNIKQ